MATITNLKIFEYYCNCKTDTCLETNKNCKIE